MQPQYHDLQYLELVKHVMAEGVLKSNRTGIRTVSVFGYDMRFNLRDGTIPLLTTKKMHTRSVIHEILWYLEGNTSSNELLRKGVSIWQEWADDKGELNNVYGHQWRNWETKKQNVVFVSPITVENTSFTPPKFPLLSPTQTDDPFVGTRHHTKECGEVIVIRLDSKDTKSDHKYDVQFVQTGYVRTAVRKSTIKRGHIIDRYLPRVYGVGYLGEYDETDPQVKQLQRHWYKILERCYDTSVIEYYDYGAKGIFVHPDWHCFATFQHDVKYIPNWNNKRRNPHLYDLDKDFYSSNCYSKNTCVWLEPKYNTLYRKNPKPFKVITPDNNELVCLSVEDVCQEFTLTKSLVYKVLNKKQLHHKKFRFEFIEPPTGTQARYQLPIDQIANVINTLKTNPNDRRMIVSAWNVGDLDKMALPPCHYTFQFYASPLPLFKRIALATKRYSPVDIVDLDINDFSKTSKLLTDMGIPAHELSLKLTQRSCDVGLGVPFNIVQYSILLHMFCEVVNMVPGDFLWSGGDVHIYENHFRQLEEQVMREPYASPTLRFARSITNIDNFTYDDFIIENYESHPTIKMEVAV